MYYVVRCVSVNTTQNFLAYPYNVRQWLYLVAKIQTTPSNTTLQLPSNPTCFDGKQPSSSVVLQNLNNHGKMFVFAESLKYYNVYLQQYCNIW